MPSYLSDYLYANSGSECPDSFWKWSALTLLGHVVGRKVWYDHGRYPLFTSLYTGLVGTAGSGKSVSKSVVKKIITDNFRDELLCSANMQTREDIIPRMGSDDNIVVWKNKETGELIEDHPFFIIANEFQNFLSVNPIGMVAFLTDIHGEESFSDSYKNKGQTFFKNPYMSILSCGTRDWVMRELKMELLAGGFGRRFILVVDEATKIVPDPFLPPEYTTTWKRVIDHLKRVRTEEIQGAWKRTALAEKWWHDWYPKHKKSKPEDPILQQFHSTEHVMTLKVATLLSLTDYNLSPVVTDSHMEESRFMFEENRPRIIALSAGAGRNDIAVFIQQMKDFVIKCDGMVEEKKLYQLFGRELRFAEYNENKEFLKKTEGFIEASYQKPNDIVRVFVFTSQTYALCMKAIGGRSGVLTPVPSPAACNKPPTPAASQSSTTLTTPPVVDPASLALKAAIVETS